jgi:teichuronic acid biosynthesis glycosyltransferase TuaG
MNSALVDVIIPNYERTNSLLMAVQSVLIQGEAINQIIVVDDGSSPDVIEFINKNILYLPKVKFISIPHSGNPAIVRNVGINQSNSKYLAFLDSDDFWFPGKIDLQLAKFKNNNVVLVCSNARVYTKYKIVKKYFTKKSKIIKKSNIWFENSVINSSVLVKSNVLKAIGGYTELNTMIGIEDYITWTRLIHEGNFYFMEECLLGYTIDEFSISFMVTQEQLLTGRQVIYDNLDHSDRLIYFLFKINKNIRITMYKIFLKV